MMASADIYQKLSGVESKGNSSKDPYSIKMERSEKENSSNVKESEKDMDDEELRENADPNEPNEIQGFPKNQKQKEKIKKEYDKARQKEDGKNTDIEEEPDQNEVIPENQVQKKDK
jgi:hypothetical protein